MFVQPLSPGIVTWIVGMLRTIDFDNKLGAAANEICDVRP